MKPALKDFLLNNILRIICAIYNGVMILIILVKAIIDIVRIIEGYWPELCLVYLIYHSISLAICLGIFALTISRIKKEKDIGFLKTTPLEVAGKIAVTALIMAFLTFLTFPTLIYQW